MNVSGVGDVMPGVYTPEFVPSVRSLLCKLLPALLLLQSWSLRILRKFNRNDTYIYLAPLG